VKIKVIAVGKLKKDYTLEGALDYKNRISHYISLEIIETDEKAIGKLINDKAYNVALERTGVEMSSIEFAKFIQEQLTYSPKDIAFFIGGADGFSAKTLEQMDFRLSFSKMTFPHEVARLLLLEQIYRAFTIINNEKYHK